MRIWLDRHGLGGATSYTMRVPPAIAAATPDLIAEFLGAYWSCDGFIAERGGSLTSCHIGADTVSEGLARDLQHLLLRLGVAARVRRKQAKLQSKRQGDIYVSWQTIISSLDHGTKFCAAVPILHAKKNQAARYVRSGFDRVLNEDRVVAIAPDGVGQCRCLSVEEDESFTAGDLAVHNSRLVSVFWPTWTWTWKPSTQFLFAAYRQELATRDAVHSRRLIQTRWYQALWGAAFRLAGDQNAKTRYENDRGGHRISTMVGTGTGEGGHCLVLDDPHNQRQVLSDAIREGVLDWWGQTWSTRKNDPKESTEVVVMQRLHERDLSGFILEEIGGYEHLCLPMHFEPERRCVTSLWSDPREETGELLWPARFGIEEAQTLAKRLGGYGVAGQLQQRPAPAEGGIFKKRHWRFWYPRGVPAPAPVLVRLADGSWVQCKQVVLPEGFDRQAQSWDMAFKDTKTSAFVVGQVWGQLQADAFLLDQVREKMDLPATCAAVTELTERWPEAAAKWVEDKANGPAVIQVMQRRIPGLLAVNPEGDKTARAHAVSPFQESGNVYLPHPALFPWVEELLAEATTFPNGAYKDQVDALTQALIKLLVQASEEFEAMSTPHARSSDRLRGF